jgi:hypothetical protein
MSHRIFTPSKFSLLESTFGNILCEAYRGVALRFFFYTEVAQEDIKELELFQLSLTTVDIDVVLTLEQLVPRERESRGLLGFIARNCVDDR